MSRPNGDVAVADLLSAQAAAWGGEIAAVVRGAVPAYAQVLSRDPRWFEALLATVAQSLRGRPDSLRQRLLETAPALGAAAVTARDTLSVLAYVREFLGRRLAGLPDGRGGAAVVELDRALDRALAYLLAAASAEAASPRAEPESPHATAARHLARALEGLSGDRTELLYQRLADEGRRILDGSQACLDVATEDRRRMCLAHSPADPAAHRGERYTLDDHPAGPVFRTARTAVLAPDEPGAGHAWTVAVAIASDGRVPAVLTVRRATRPTAQEVRLVERFAALAAFPVDLARRVDLADRQRRELESLHAVATVAASGTGFEAALDQLAERLRELLGADGTYVQLLGPDRRTMRTAAAAGPLAEAWRGRDQAADAGAAGLVLRSGRSYLVRDVRHADGDAELVAVALGQTPLQSLLAVPLRHAGRAFGVLTAGSLTPYRFDAADVALAETFAASAALAIDNARLYQEAKAQARLDGLTGLKNHRALQEDLDEALSALDDGRTLVLAVLDLDDFKVVNDTFGHLAGDRTLVQVARLLSAHLRAVDGAYRFGGEEFALMLRDVPPMTAHAILERIRLAVANSEAPDVPKVTVSVGFAVAPRHAATRQALLAAADRAMYTSKSRGKNRVTSYDGAAPTHQDEHQSGRSAQSALTVLAMSHPQVAQRSRRAARIARRLALACGMSAGHAEQVATAALLCDIGFVGLPASALAADGAGPEAAAMYRSHPERSVQALGNMSLEWMAPWVRVHHEHMDGSGLPDGVDGERIAPEGRILAVADAVAEWTAPPAPLDVNAIMERLSRHASWYDPVVLRRVPDVLRAMAANDRG
jgi:diguanylate cyclase (GGDEF)-like protein